MLRFRGAMEILQSQGVEIGPRIRLLEIRGESRKHFLGFFPDALLRESDAEIEPRGIETWILLERLAEVRGGNREVTYIGFEQPLRVKKLRVIRGQHQAKEA